MTEHVDRRADTTRLQIMRAAAHQFACRSYGRVNLDDILADAEVTKGALYFHFRSKHALASAIVDYRSAQARASIEDLLAQKLSGLESLVDISFLLALDDIGDEMARAGLNLLESIGRSDGLQFDVLGTWIAAYAAITRKAITEGDVGKHVSPEDVARVLVSMYMGLRQTSSLDKPEQFLHDMEKAWELVMPGFVESDRRPYLTQFIKRRTLVAVKKATALQIG